MKRINLASDDYRTTTIRYNTRNIEGNANMTGTHRIRKLWVILHARVGPLLVYNEKTLGERIISGKLM